MLQINGFFNNQNINKDREAPSNFTPPDGNSRPTPELLKSTSAESKLREDKVIEDVLTDLNSCLKTAYKTTNVKTRELIRARLNDGFTLENFKTVHRKKISEWGNDKEMRVYLRPITLYGTKFESYLNQPELKEVGGGFKKP